MPMSRLGKGTRKNAQVVSDLQIRCNKVVVKPISGCVRTACSQLLWQVWNKLLTCYHLVTIVSTRLIQAVRNKLLRACCHQLVNNCRRYQTCWNNLLRVCRPHQPCYKMITTCSRLVNNWEQAVRTHLLDNLWDFYACTSNESLQYSLHSSAFWMMVFKAHFSPFNWKN
jgi:hypothetical protein